MQTVQLALGDPNYAAALSDTLKRSGVWDVVPVDNPDPDRNGVLVLDENSLNRLPLPLKSPERVVLITQNDPRQLARAWEAGIVSVLFHNASPNTVMLAIMSAALRTPKRPPAAPERGISPTPATALGNLDPEQHQHGVKRSKTQ